jgi:hypothetical protein
VITLDEIEAMECAAQAEVQGMNHLARFFRYISDFIATDGAIVSVSIDFDRDVAQVFAAAQEKRKRG